ncbi:hypothetical protein PMAYCL1PPCAC_06730, partial [Pristionchus mayeri]
PLGRELWIHRICLLMRTARGRRERAFAATSRRVSEIRGGKRSPMLSGCPSAYPRMRYTLLGIFILSARMRASTS